MWQTQPAFPLSYKKTEIYFWKCHNVSIKWSTLLKTFSGPTEKPWGPAALLPAKQMQWLSSSGPSACAEILCSLIPLRPYSRGRISGSAMENRLCHRYRNCKDMKAESADSVLSPCLRTDKLVRWTNTLVRNILAQNHLFSSKVPHPNRYLPFFQIHTDIQYFLFLTRGDTIKKIIFQGCFLSSAHHCAVWSLSFQLSCESFKLTSQSQAMYGH